MFNTIAGPLLWIGPHGGWGGVPEALKVPPRLGPDYEQALEKAGRDLMSRPMLDPEIRKMAAEFLRKAEESLRETDERMRRLDERMRRFDEQQRPKQNQVPPAKPLTDQKP